jgi:hypothetical protein
MPYDSKLLCGVRPWAIDRSIASALRDLSERLTGRLWPG